MCQLVVKWLRSALYSQYPHIGCLLTQPCKGVMLRWSQVKNDQILLSKVPNEASQQAGFNGVHNFGVSTPPGVEN